MSNRPTRLCRLNERDCRSSGKDTAQNQRPPRAAQLPTRRPPAPNPASPQTPQSLQPRLPAQTGIREINGPLRASSTHQTEAHRTALVRDNYPRRANADGAAKHPRSPGQSRERTLRNQTCQYLFPSQYGRGTPLAMVRALKARVFCTTPPHLLANRSRRGRCRAQRGGGAGPGIRNPRSQARGTQNTCSIKLAP